ncbi:hypothetical protein N7507_010387 [Penicillium longicatenatum]|nr:hypothetical protein N7507_010387 [Penicillium longicatenatum]
MISIAQAVSYELTDDRKLKAVLLDNDGNEHESELCLDDYLVLDDYRSPYLKFEHYYEFKKGVRDLCKIKMFIHRNKKWGRMLCVDYNYQTWDRDLYVVEQRLSLGHHFWNDNGTLRFEEMPFDRMEGMPEGAGTWKMYFGGDYLKAKKYANHREFLEKYMSHWMRRNYSGYVEHGETMHDLIREIHHISSNGLVDLFHRKSWHAGPGEISSPNDLIYFLQSGYGQKSVMLFLLTA